MASVRRLTAILAADVAGYSRLMGVDEEDTHERLKAHLRELVDPKIRGHRGRVVKNTGDGVNVAARLQALAEPGGICISRVVRDQIRDKLPYPFEDRGEQSVKNIARPVRVYGLSAAAVPDLPRSSLPPTKPVSHPAVAPRLSIVVLPFMNLSSNPDQQYFADGITEDLTTDLSRLADMLVISHSSAFTYKDKAVNARQIGRELGVRYVLEGSVQRSANRVRVNAQLIDAADDLHLWAERFDGDAGDLFALQDEITSRIAVALDLELVGAEASRPIEHPDTRDYILRGRAVRLKPPSRVNRAEQVLLFERALELDQDSVAAQSWLAIELAARALDSMTDTPAVDIARAGGLAERALGAAPRSSLAHFAKAQVLRAQHRLEEAIPEYETVIALNRNWAHAYSHLGWCKFMTGAIEALIPAQERAILISPSDPQIGLFYSRIGRAHLLQSQLDEAIIWCEKARNATPAAAIFRSFLASAYALTGDSERAAVELAEARSLVGDDRYATIAALQAVEFWGVPKIRALYEATYFSGLRKAGMADQ